MKPTKANLRQTRLTFMEALKDDHITYRASKGIVEVDNYLIHFPGINVARVIELDADGDVIDQFLISTDELAHQLWLRKDTKKNEK